MSVELSIIIPTYNERENIKPLIDAVGSALSGIDWEIVFVDDDSQDKTADLIKEISKDNNKIRCIQRIGRKGLSSACIEGVLSTSSPYIAVMDADLQHDESILIDMLSSLKTEEIDIAIGSRYTEGGSIGKFRKKRFIISSVATFIGHMIIQNELKDPMSGFFIVKREFFNKTVHNLSGKGFKILLDLFASSNDEVRFKEIPYRFRERNAGESKLDTLAFMEYALLIADKTIGRIIPVGFVLFVIAGIGGAFLYISIMYLLLKQVNASFVVSQTLAAFAAMTLNFFLNNIFTFRYQRIKGKRIFVGLFFVLHCMFSRSIFEYNGRFISL